MGEGGITHNSNLPSALYQRCPARELPSAGSSSRIFGPLSSALCPAVYLSVRPSVPWTAASGGPLHPDQ